MSTLTKTRKPATGVKNSKLNSKRSEKTIYLHSFHSLDLYLDVLPTIRIKETYCSGRLRKYAITILSKDYKAVIRDASRLPSVIATEF